MDSFGLEQVGPYRIIREIGRGGMGVVYLAHDDRLDRPVAIKALPDELAADPGRLERFEREAKTLASLNHPNIAAIYGVEEQQGQKYLVLEYVEGETLADRLDRGPLPVDEAIEIAVEIASGVEAAHEAGVIHRDLKPDNIKITPDGRVKVLDFGLARAEEGVSSTGTQGPTLTTPRSPTMPGAVLGTAPYMSPEQARGRRVDKRTDIWSFGVILYEMLTGSNPFSGESANDSIGAVLHKDFDPKELPSGTTAAARRVIHRCVQRDKNLRYRDIGDARIELASGSVDVDTGQGVIGVGMLIGAAAAASLVTAAVVWGVRSVLAPEPERLPVQLSMELDDRYPLHRNPRPAISGDGRRVLFRARHDRLNTILIRDLDGEGFRELENTDELANFTISWDGEWMLFDDDQNRLRKMPIDGGPAVTICEAPSMNGGSWAEDGTIVFAPEWDRPLARVSADGGEPVPLYERTSIRGLDLEEMADLWPRVLPGGKWVVFNRVFGPEWDNTFLMVVPVDGGEPRELVRGAINGRYMGSGHLVYQREDTLFAVGFDLRRAEITTEEVPVLRGLNRGWITQSPRFDLSANGTLVYVPGAWAQDSQQIGLMALDGSWTPLTEREEVFWGIRPSNDDRFVALEKPPDRDGSVSIEVLELGRDLQRPLPRGGVSGIQRAPVWHPDSRSLVFARRNESTGARELCRYRVGSATVDVLRSEENPDRALVPQDWSSDGRTLVCWVRGTDDSLDLAALRFDESGGLVSEEAEVLVDWPGLQIYASLSPDDQWMLFRGETAGGYEMFVVSLEDPSWSVQVSVDGGNFGAWAPDGKRLYYTDDDVQPIVMYAVDYTVSEQGDFIPSPPQPLFEIERISDIDSLELTADGSAFYMPREVSDQVLEPEAPRVIVAWDELLREVLPEPE